METLITHGVRVTVESFYQPGHSEPNRNRFLHVYNIRIENKNSFPIQLLKRRWLITESNGTSKIVEGDGVIGKQPMIETGKFHAYSSYSILSTDFGQMSGVYMMLRPEDNTAFEVTIPPFGLIVPSKLN